MILHILRTISWRYPRSVFAALGAVWLVVAPAIGLGGKSIPLKYWQLLALSAVFGAVCLIIDGIWVSGFLKKSIQIKSNSFDTTITVMFSNLFHMEGWQAVAVNDFFDSRVDDFHVSSKSLHGKALLKYWGGNIENWDDQVQSQLQGCAFESVARSSGKNRRYEIGATAAATKGANKLLFVALTHTDTQTLQCKASSSDLNKAVRGLLQKARSVCANEPLNIPLMGSGLARVGMKSNILVNHILTAVFEETRLSKVTGDIRIVLPLERISEINLTSLKRDWS